MRHQRVFGFNLVKAGLVFEKKISVSLVSVSLVLKILGRNIYYLRENGNSETYHRKCFVVGLVFDFRIKNHVL